MFNDGVAESMCRKRDSMSQHMLVRRTVITRNIQKFNRIGIRNKKTTKLATFSQIAPPFRFAVFSRFIAKKLIIFLKKPILCLYFYKVIFRFVCFVLFTYPQDQTSTAVVYRSCPRSNSGGRYQRVITRLV